MPVPEDDDLETGYTTGTCATAVTRAALADLLTDQTRTATSFQIPAGETANLDVERVHREGHQARYSTVKDAGDDPDVTDGATITATVIREPTHNGSDLTLEAGDGVGTITMPGMPVDRGEPAINPTPRSMIRSSVQNLLDTHNCTDPVTVKIGVESGRELAQQTLNPRLGIEDGLSILGTTGIVQPYSHASFIASIEQGIDVARTNGVEHLVLSTGGRTEAAAMQAHPALPDYAFIQFGGFLKAALDHLQANPVPRLSLYMMPGKFAKFMQGNFQLHSSDSEVDMGSLRQTLRQAVGLNGDELPTVPSVNQTLSGLPDHKLPTIGDDWVRRGRTVLNQWAQNHLPETEFQLVLLDLDGNVLGEEAWAA